VRVRVRERVRRRRMLDVEREDGSMVSIRGQCSCYGKGLVRVQLCMQ
jgi:hypothetical protein